MPTTPADDANGTENESDPCRDSANHVEDDHQADLDFRLRMYLDGPGG